MKRKQNIDLRQIKRFAIEELPKDWLLRDIILSEQDELYVDEYITKAEVWLKLFKSEKK